MKKGIAFMLVFFACILVADLSAGSRWNLTFEPGAVERISIKTGMTWDAYWYLTYKVTNNTDQEISMRLGIKATSDVANKTYLEGYYKRVEEAIEKAKGKKFLNIRDMRTTIGPGETMDAVAIFGKVVESTDLLTIQVKGLWDIISQEGQKTFVEEKALNLIFNRPGDEYYPQYDKIVLIKKEWVVLSRREK